MLKILRKFFKPQLFTKPRIALFIDGPNLLRKEFRIDLNVIKAKIEEHGCLRQAQVFLNQFAPNKLVEAVANQGFEPVIGVGEKLNDEQSDVDVYMAVHAMKAVYNKNVDIIALMTRDADFLPILQEAKRRGKKTIVLGREPGFSRALQHAADHVIDLGR